MNEKSLRNIARVFVTLAFFSLPFTFNKDKSGQYRFLTANTAYAASNEVNSKYEFSEDMIVKVMQDDGSIVTENIFDYVVGVTSRELGPNYSEETIKVQGVIALGYVVPFIQDQNAKFHIKSSQTNQVYYSKEQRKKIWGNKYDEYESKIESAVREVFGEFLCYNGELIQPLYYSMSNGKTEDSSEVWGNSFDYYKSVDSHWAKDLPGFEQTTDPIALKDFYNKLGLKYNDEVTTKILSRTKGDRVKTISINGKVYSGTEVRKVLDLKSTDFEIKQIDDSVVITTRGFGHGVGVPQKDAEILAQQGKTYKEILTYYYKGTYIVFLGTSKETTQTSPQTLNYQGEESDFHFVQVIHTVEDKEYLYSIAKEYNVTVEEIMKENKLTTDVIQPDQDLKIPAYYYKVQEGDTVYSITKEANELGINVTTEKIQDTNSLDEYKIKPGEILVIPDSNKEKTNDDTKSNSR